MGTSAGALSLGPLRVVLKIPDGRASLLFIGVVWSSVQCVELECVVCVDRRGSALGTGSFQTTPGLGLLEMCVLV